MKHTTALAKLPIPTGNPWLSSPDDPATVPVPLPVIIVSVEGPYTEQDRKLWTFLLHAVWDELGERSSMKYPFEKLRVSSETFVAVIIQTGYGNPQSGWPTQG